MNAQHPDPLSADSVSFGELALACAFSVAELQELIEYGALAPLQPLLPEPLFAIRYLEPLRTASKLRRDYDLDLFVVVLLMDYLQRIAQLESQLDSLQAQRSLPH
jgi:chaperone modulatory protein CbpM